MKSEIILKVNQAISRTVSLKQSLAAALDILAETETIISGAVLLRAETKAIFTVKASHGHIRPNSGVTVRLGEGIVGKTAENGIPVIISRLSEEPTYLEQLALYNSQQDNGESYLVYPLLLEGRVEGIFCVVLSASSEKSLEDLNEIMTLIASMLELSIKYHYILQHERERFVNENVVLKQKLQEEFSFHNLIGKSHEMRDIYEQVAQVARSKTTVLLRGESGTGKELIAEAIHYNSLVREKPFVRVNCAAIPDTLIESEFFGYEKGAFTGAAAQKRGRFEMANSGTIFLDEIGDLSPMTQVKLLRVLQDQSFERVGGTETIQVDVRVVAATNSDLEELIKTGGFREDLYYRLNVFSIYLPPLRDRKTDILLLADHFMLKYGRQHGKIIKRLSTPAIDSLMAYHWPGNVRELENCIERAVLVCDDQVIHSYHLPPSLQTGESSDTIAHRSLDKAVAAYEKDLILDALKSSRGNRARAARLLETTERIIGYKVKKLGIDLKRLKP